MEKPRNNHPDSEAPKDFQRSEETQRAIDEAKGYNNSSALGGVSVASLLNKFAGERNADGRTVYGPTSQDMSDHWNGVIQGEANHNRRNRHQAAQPQGERSGGRHHRAPEQGDDANERPQPTAEDLAARRAAEARRDMYDQAQGRQERAVPLYFSLDDNGNPQFTLHEPTDRDSQRIGDLNLPTELPTTDRQTEGGQADEDEDYDSDGYDEDGEYEDDDDLDQAAARRAGRRASRNPITRALMGWGTFANWRERRNREKANRRAAERTQAPDESDEEYAERMRGADRRENRRSKWGRILGIGALTAVAGGYLASRGHLINFTDMYDDITPWDTNHEKAEHAQIAQAEADRIKAERDAFVAKFVYHPEEDWALKPNKDHINDFGPFLSPNPDTDGNRFPGYGDFIDNRVVDNQRQFAAALSEAGYPGVPTLEQFNGDDQAFSIALNQWADGKTPEQLADLYLDYRHNWMEHANTKFEVLPIDAAYESYYQDRADGLVKYDRHVDYGGTMVKVTYPNGKVAWLRCDCSQWIRPNAVVPVEQWSPAPAATTWSGGGGEAAPATWSSNGGGVRQHSQGRTQVWTWGGNNGGGQPPVDQPPTDQPPVDQPPTDQPPTDQPPENKGQAYPDAPFRDLGTGAGEFMPAPAHVDTTVETPGLNGQAGVTDNVTNDPGTVTGAQNHDPGVTQGGSGLDTRGNAQAGGGIEGGTGAAGVGGSSTGGSETGGSAGGSDTNSSSVDGNL